MLLGTSGASVWHAYLLAFLPEMSPVPLCRNIPNGLGGAWVHVVCLLEIFPNVWVSLVLPRNNRRNNR
jgi:hypothetical protein